MIVTDKTPSKKENRTQPRRIYYLNNPDVFGMAVPFIEDVLGPGRIEPHSVFAHHSMTFGKLRENSNQYLALVAELFYFQRNTAELYPNLDGQGPELLQELRSTTRIPIISFSIHSEDFFSYGGLIKGVHYDYHLRGDFSPGESTKEPYKRLVELIREIEKQRYA